MPQTQYDNPPKLDYNLDTVEGCRKAYRAARWWARFDQGVSYEEFDRRVAKVLNLAKVEDPTPEQYVRAAHSLEWNCGRCAGTGKYVTMVLNGSPTGPGGICYRCNGKGMQRVSDFHRNYWYDRKGRAYYV